VTSTTTPGLRERKKEETRDALASAALRLVDERGLEHVTVDDIAAAAGVSPRTFFNYFPSKEDAIVGSSPTFTAAVVQGLLDRPDDEPPLESLRNAIHVSADHLESEPEAWFVRRRLAARYPSLAVLHSARLASVERELVVEIARRARLDPDTDTYPGVVVGAALAAARVALAAWGARARRGSLPALFDEVFAQLALGLPAPPAARRASRTRSSRR
jgi:AcrR family transcriptional regulator